MGSPARDRLGDHGRRDDRLGDDRLRLDDDLVGDDIGFGLGGDRLGLGDDVGFGDDRVGFDVGDEASTGSGSGSGTVAATGATMAASRTGRRLWNRAEVWAAAAAAA